MPYLKSFNQVANNQAGAANLGNAMAFFGMESWARHIAQESYLPFWAGSHLFLADRYPGEFNKRSELMQGFLLDPIAFGASNRYQTLAETPGNYAMVSAESNRSDDYSLVGAMVTANGYLLAPTPVAYFAEVIGTHIAPGNTAFGGNMQTYRAALGFRPRWDSSFFIYATRLAVDIDLGTRDVTGLFQHVAGYSNRVDAGGHYALDANSQFWFKAGYSGERSSVEEASSIVIPGLFLARSSNFVTQPTGTDAQLRHTMLRGDGREFTWGLEAARAKTPNALVQDAFLHGAGALVPQNSLDSVDRDRSALAYGLMRISAARWTLDALLGWSDYRKDRNFHISVQSPAATADIAENYRRDGASGAFGAVYRVPAGWVGRLACQAWTRPASLGTLAPVAIAGIVTDDKLVFPGGKVSRCRGQAEWEAGQDTFVTLGAEHQIIHNLYSPLDGVLNTRGDLTNLDRLRNRILPLPPKPDTLEGVPVFSLGKVTRASLALEHIVMPSLAARFNYTFTDSANTHEAFRDNLIPYLPRHQAGVGATWTHAARSYVSAQAVYRSPRFADEDNQIRLEPGWDMQVRAYLEFDRKHWSLEAYALNLLKKNASDVFGIIVNYRF